MSVPSSTHPTLVPNAVASSLFLYTLFWMRFLLILLIVYDKDIWVHHRADGEPTASTTVAYDNGGNPAPVDKLLPAPKK